MKLCIVTSSFRRFRGDYAGQHVYSQAEDLARHHEVHVIYPTDRENPHMAADPFIHHPFPYPFRNYPMAQVHGFDLLNTPRFFSRMAAEIKRVKQACDIEVFYAFWTIPAGFACALACGDTPYVIGLMGSDDKVFGRLGIARPFISYAIRRSARLIALSQELRRQALNMGFPADHISVIPSGIDVDVYRPYERETLRLELGLTDKRIVLYVGSLFKLKRVDWLIRLSARLGRYYDFKTVIIGDGPERKNLEKLANDTGCRNVCFLGRVPYEQVPRYMAAADTLVLFSTTEGLPSSAQEALSCGTPVIATDVGGLSDLIRNGTTGYLVNRESEAAAALERIFTAPDQGRAMGRLAREFAVRYLSREVTSRKVGSTLEAARTFGMAGKPSIGLLSTFPADFISGVIDVQLPLVEKVNVVAPRLDRTDVSFYRTSYRIGSNPVSNVLHQTISQAKMAFRVLQINRKVDFWVFLGGDVFVLPMVMAKLLGKPVFLTLLGDLRRETLMKENPLNPVQLLLRNVNCHMANRIVLLSGELVRRWGLERFAAKCRVGQSQHVDPGLFRVIRPLEERERIVGYIGRLSPEKGIKEMVEAMPLVVARDEGVRFLITGDGPLAEDIHDQVRRAGLEKTVQFTGRVPYRDIPEILNRCRLLVMPSRSEGLPATLLEALACGTPVLATPVGAVADIISEGETGYFLKDISSEEIAAGILKALDATDLETMSRKARQLAETEYCLETARQDYREIIREGVVLSRGNRQPVEAGKKHDGAAHEGW